MSLQCERFTGDSTVSGYSTGLFGKYLNGYGGVDGIPPGWDEWFAVLIPAGYYDYDVNYNGSIRSFGSGPEDYQTDVLTRRALRFMRRAHRSERPFFVYLSTKAPHGRHVAAPRHERRFAGWRAPRVPSFNEEDVSDKVSFVRRLPLLSESEVKSADRVLRRRMESMLAVVDAVNGILDFLGDRNLLDQTYIFFTSDNGWHMGEHRLPRGKGKPYEEDIRVPMVVRGPGIPKGLVVSDLTLNIDIAPTIAELAGVEVPPFVDGRSFLRLARGFRAPGSWRRGFAVESWTGVRFRALRTVDVLYAEWADNANVELYDMKNDEFQLDNRASSTPTTELDALAAWLEATHACARRGCRAAERGQD